MISRNLKKFFCAVVAFSFSIFGTSARLVELIKIIPGIMLDIRYSTTNNFTHEIVYPSSRCFLRDEVANALANIQKELAKDGLGLKIFDGYRPLSVQRIFWSICPDSRYVANPEKGSKHNRGTAVDLTLIDLKTGKELEMPSGFDDFSEKAWRNYNAMTKEAAKNCKNLEDIMVKNGFLAPYEEWWHFNFIGWEKYPVVDISFDEIDKDANIERFKLLPS